MSSTQVIDLAFDRAPHVTFGLARACASVAAAAAYTRRYQREEILTALGHARLDLAAEHLPRGRPVRAPRSMSTPSS